MALNVLSIGEAMVEFAPAGNGLWRQGFAGDTLNVAWAMRALLPDDATVRYVTRIGDDRFSQRFRGFLRASGIADDLIETDPDHAIGLYTIETDEQGERSFAYWRGQSAARQLGRQLDQIARACDTADLVYLSGITLAILPAEARQALIALLGARGRRRFRLAFDPNIRPRLWPDLAAARASVTQMAGIADILLPTFDDEQLAFGDAGPEATLARYAALGADEIVVKNGTRPTSFRCGADAGLAPLPSAVQAVDTTGAGDSFNGGYLSARLLGIAPVAAIAIGQAVSGLVVTRPGALVDRADLAEAARAARP